MTAAAGQIAFAGLGPPDSRSKRQPSGWRVPRRCTQIGADAAPPGSAEHSFGPALETDTQLRLSGYRWMTIVLFGEGLGSEFERGVGQYPTIGDEVHLVTNDDLKIIYPRTTSLT